MVLVGYATSSHEIEKIVACIVNKRISWSRMDSAASVTFIHGKVGSKASGTSLYQELERSRMLNRKLKERLAATEQTVRQQADRLNKCRAALRKSTRRDVVVFVVRSAVGWERRSHTFFIVTCLDLMCVFTQISCMHFQASNKWQKWHATSCVAP